MLHEYKTKTIRKTGKVTSYYQLQINGDILRKAKEAAAKKGIDVNDYIIQAILKCL